LTTLLADIHEAYTKDPQYVKALRQRRTAQDPLQVRGGYLYFGNRLGIPADLPLQERILKECHDAPTGGHLGIEKTLEQVKRRFYWPGMDATIL
jgi:hypothetical protein